MNTIVKIPKEQLPAISWPVVDVISDEGDQVIRKEKLHRAMILGNTEKIKTSICFKSKNGEEFMVETTIWALTEKYVCLKHGITIPLKAITQVDI